MKYVPNQKFIDDGANILSSLLPWEKAILASLALLALILFLAFGYSGDKFKKIRNSGVNFLLSAISLLFVISSLMISFAYGNDFGWFQGTLLFLSTIVLAVSTVFSGITILYFVFSITKWKHLRNWKLWSYLLSGLTALTTSVLLFSHLISKS